MNAEKTVSTSRRDFLKTTAAAIAAPCLVSASVLGATGHPPPSERIRLGLIGCGGMGRANLHNCVQYPDVVVTGACDPWKSRRDAVVAQFPDTCRPYADYRELLQQPDLDAVIIASPPHWHALQAIAACEAGKDLFLQKPMTLHLGESLAIRNAVQRHQIISQIGTQIHAGDNYRRVVEFIRSGNLGPISAARTFNVMNQAPDGVGRATYPATPAGLD
jgi:predicted dehydrogenase